MRSTTYLTAAIALMMGTAGAAANGTGAPPPPPPEGPIGYGEYEYHDWAGIYVGVQGGWLWGQDEAFEIFTNSGLVGDGPLPYDTDGYAVGGLLGINMQVGHWVYGGEIDVEYADFSGEWIWPTSGNRIRKDIGVAGSLRARAGFATDWFFVYGTGGLAVGDVEMETVDIRLFESISGSQTEFGWTAGGGLEIEIFENWSVGFEYRYTDLGQTEINGEIFPARDENGDLIFDSNGDRIYNDFTYSHTNQFHAVRARLVYRMQI